MSLHAGHVVTSKGAPRQFLHLPAAGAKGGQSRVVPLNATAQKAVAALLTFNRTRGFSVAQDAPLFVNRYHKRLPVRTVQFIFQHLRERADLDVRATPHTARHTFGTQAVRKTGDVRAAQKILGHYNITIYLHPTAQGMARVNDSLVAAPVGNGRGSFWQVRALQTLTGKTEVSRWGATPPPPRSPRGGPSAQAKARGSRLGVPLRRQPELSGVRQLLCPRAFTLV